MTPTVLVVEGSLTVRMNLADALRAAAFTVIPCATAAQARGVLQREVVDVIVAGTSLPDANGIAFLDEVREAKRVPVVLLGAADGAGCSDTATGFCEPHDAAALVDSVRAFIRGTKTGVEPAILLIDDSPTARAEIGAGLRAQGFRVATASSGEEGLRKAAEERPSAVIVDGVLPGIDGATVIRRLRLDAALRRVPCLLLTASQGVEAELRALDAGADAFVNKAEDPTVILAKLRAALRVAPEPDEGATKSWLSLKRILVVGASGADMRQIAGALSQEGYEVQTAQSGTAAIERVASEPPDCVLLDVAAPTLDVLDVCRRIRSSPSTASVPIVVLGEVADRATVLSCFREGADDYVQQSADLEILKARLRVQLRKRQMEDEIRRTRERILAGQIEAAEARAARELAATRAALVNELEERNRELTRLMNTKVALAEGLERANRSLEHAYRELAATQSKLVHSAKMASLGGLVAGVAHEINNPLAFVLSHLDTVQRLVGKLSVSPGGDRQTHDCERAHNRLDEMRHGLTRIRDLVIKLRTFSRLDEGESKAASIRENVESVLTILGHRIRDPVRVVTRFGEPEVIQCYPALLNQALMNVVTNALDALVGGGTISIACGADSDRYVVEVSDTGPGIPSELRERVIEPFFTTKPPGQGTGLGLSITYSIVQKHGGTLQLLDAAGGGARVVMSLPLSLRGDSTERRR